MIAARRAIKLHGRPPALAGPLLVEIVPPSNIAVGTVPWGLGNFVRDGSVRRISTSGDAASEADAVLTAAGERPLLVIVRDAHRYPVAREVVRKLLSVRPDTVIVEMGLPVWHPADLVDNPAQVFVATYGATSASSRAAAELLGLESKGNPIGPDRS